MIFADGFESGSLSAWSAVVDPKGKLQVTTAAALVGSKGLAVSLSGSNSTVFLPFVVKSSLGLDAAAPATPQPMALRDDTPQSESRYRARFYFDPNSIEMSTNSTHRILTAGTASVEAIVLDVGRASNSYQLRGGLRTNSGKVIYTGWYTLSDAPHAVEFDWQAATAGSSDGHLSVSLDGVLKQTRNGIDNSNLRIDQVELGPVAGSGGGAKGTEFFDDFVSQRTNPIGM